MDDIAIDALPTLRALRRLGFNETSVADGIGRKCDPETVLTWTFDMPMNATRRPEWVEGLILFAMKAGFDRLQDVRGLGPYADSMAAEVLRCAVAMLTTWTDAVRKRDEERV